jgi:pimeloyl-ACP methyl ester carboxylesterase
MGAPVNVVARQVQVKYTGDWKPVELSIEAVVQGETLTHRATVDGGVARGQRSLAGQTTQLNDSVAADAVLLPNLFWGPFEALAERLRTAPAGSSISAYVSPASVEIQVGQSSEETFQTAARTLRVRRTAVKIPTEGPAPLDVEVWGDDAGRLVRLSIPAQNLDVVREDIASVASRRVVVSRPGDEQVRIPADGFTLAATISKPAAAGDRPLPAVVLCGGSGPTDRDGTAFGIPIFGQLANALADAGFLVVRYDKRGVGQSGGRAEAAALNDFSEDLRAVLRFTANRRDVDRRRIAVAGHSEGAAVAMLAASKENRIAALVLIAAMGVTGAELNMYQVTHALERSNRPEAEKQATIDLQKRIQSAVLTGKGWEEVAPAVRRQADTPWFQSFLAFDPVKIMPDIDQPVLVVQGDLDTQVPPSNADRLETAARARNDAGGVEVVKVAGVNHLLVPAISGEYDEYAGLTDKRVSPSIIQPIASWLQRTFAR